MPMDFIDIVCNIRRKASMMTFTSIVQKYICSDWIISINPLNETVNIETDKFTIFVNNDNINNVDIQNHLKTLNLV